MKEKDYQGDMEYFGHIIVSFWEKRL